jgi:DNA-binding CsgD family transcriptional regulator
MLAARPSRRTTRSERERRDLEMLEARRAGLTWDRIAAQLGLTTRQVYYRLRKLRERLRAEGRE